jgi:uncharacterized membrane protein
VAIGKLHVLLLHFPVALIIVAALADALWLRWRKPLFREAGYYCILLGALAAIPTMITGSMLIDTLKLTVSEAALGEIHETLGILTTSIVVLAAGVRLLGRNKLTKTWAWMYGALMAGLLVLVSLTGHFGGMLAFGKDYLSGVI